MIIVSMTDSVLKDFLKNLECSVCLDVCTDPRMLPCPKGGHTLCKKCLDGLVRGPTITCPECRAKHNVPPSGTHGFPRNIMAAGMIDSLCKECWITHPEVTCSHCDKMLCRSCHVAHQAFDAVKQSVDKLRVVIQKGGKDMKEAEINQLGAAIEHEIDQAMDQLADQLADRRKTLKAELRNMIREQLDSLKTWRKELDRKTSEAQTHLDTADRELGDEYSDQITNQQMTDITSQSQHKINEIESIISEAPSIPKPVLKYNSHQAVSAISSFGSIELLPADAVDCPTAVDSSPLTPDRPIVAGKTGPALCMRMPMPRTTDQMASTAGQAGPRASYKYMNNMRDPQPRRTYQPQMASTAGQAGPRASYKYTNNMRNPQPRRTYQPQMASTAGPRASYKYTSNMRDPQPRRTCQQPGPLTESMLADAPLQDQKQILGERLFPLIQSMHPDMAGKVTGMLLEITKAELLHMLENGESLKAKVDEAVAVLKAHQAKEVASTQTGTKGGSRVLGKGGNKKI